MLLCLAAACLAACGPRPAPVRPNVILVVIDALRADHLSHYGYDRDTARGLDRFATAATRFSDCHALSPWTNPSVASLFTGLYTASHRTNAFGSVLPPELISLAEVLQAAGWHTAAVSFNPGVRSELNFDQGFQEFDEFLGSSHDYPDISEMVVRVDSWLQSTPQRPFLLYLHPMNVHGPYRVPSEYRSRLLGRPPSREFRYYQDFMKAIMNRGEVHLRREVPTRYVESLVDQYDTAVQYTCDQLDRLFSRFESAGVFDDSLVVVAADHGEELFDHGGFSHGWSLYDEVLHVPLYVKLPGQRRAAVVDEPVMLIDILPTILELAGIGVAADLDGRSLAPFLDARAAKEPSSRPHRLYQTAWRGRCEARAIADARFKLIEITSNYEGLRDTVQLYDLAADPGEQADLATSRPEEVDRLRTELERSFSAAAARAVAAPAIRVEALDQERLKALGYLDDGQR